jgi:ABC-type branched-subunit amino acid transport system ATPase component
VQALKGVMLASWVATRVACGSAWGIAVALLGNSKLMIVHEPTAGLDPAERVHYLLIDWETDDNVKAVWIQN